MKRTALAVLAFGALAVVPVPASASHYQGGCSFASNNDPSGEVMNPGDQTGAIVATIVGGTTADCWIEVNGAEAPGTRATFTAPGNGVIVGAHPVTYNAPEGTVTQLCEQVDGDAKFCGTADEFEFPPDEFWDAIDLLFATIDGVLANLDPVFNALTELEKQFVDPVVCPVLKSLAGTGDPAVVGITGPDGDVYVLDVLFWDCPEYETL